mmetsp:Transcript_15759/g.43575  ORF Transcript_15759/g.43575 Transcript_15759/m.43575 type:complete len:491 (-) Transcript_15759:12-1484(-)
MALELRAFHALLAADEADGRVAGGQVQLEDHAAHRLALQRALRHIGRQIAGIRHRQAHPPHVGAEGPHLGADQLQLRQAHRQLRQPAGEARRLALAQVWRRVAPVVHLVPATDLDRAELRVLEGRPVDMGLALALLVAPLQQLEVVLHRVGAVPVDPLGVLDAGLLVGRPQLDHPEQRAEVLVDPVLGAGDDVLGVVAEVLVDADGRVAAVLFAQGRELLEQPQVLGRHVLVAAGAAGAQDDAAVGVEADRRADVGMLGDEVHHRAHLGFAGGVGPGAELLELLAPIGGEVAVQVQAFAVGVDLEGQPVMLLDKALGDQAVVLAAELAGLARHHQPRVGGVLLVAAMGVGHAHRQDAAVAVDVLDGQAVDRFLGVGVGACRAADMARPVGQGQLGAVGVQARHQVNGAAVEQAVDLRGLGAAAAVQADELVQVVQAGGGRGQLGRVDVAVHPERRLVDVHAAGQVGHDDHPDVAALVALADRAHRHQVGP